MTRLAVVISGLAACAQAPDGLLVVTGKGVVDPAHPATVDVRVGVDRGLVFAPLTGTRPFVLDALPDDTDRAWDDTSRPYQVLLSEVATDADLYVVLRGHQGDRRFGGNLRRPVMYPGAGLYQVTADLYAPGDAGVCVHGTAEDAGYEVELVASAITTNDRFDCDQDAVPYPDDCTDYDAAVRPMPAYPPTSGIETPEALMCCNGDVPQPAQITTRRAGPDNCRMSVGCPGAPPFLLDLDLPWVVTPPFGTGGSYCDCVEAIDDPLDCLTDAHATILGDPGSLAQHPFCDLAVDDDGAVCPGQVFSLRQQLREHLPAGAGPCAVRIVWQAGAASLSFRDPDTGETSAMTTSCEAVLQFDPAGPPPGPLTQFGAFGWYIVDVNGKLVAMHVHPQAVAGCDRPPNCALE